MGAVSELRGSSVVRSVIRGVHVIRVGRFSRVGRAASAFGGACLLSALFATTPASAQSASAPLLRLPAPSDDGLGEPGALLPFSTFTPLRLSLTSGLFPIESKILGCDSRADPSGNSLNGFPIERYSYLRLTPRLTLHGFSSGGCPVDAGLGGGLSYASPLGKKLWLVSSVGFYALPPPDMSMSALVSTSARVDLVKQLPAGHVLNFGLGTRNRSGSGSFNAVSFGGNF